MLELNEVYLMDNIRAMAEIPDKYFELAIVDPEYRDDNQPDKTMRAKGGMNNWHGMPKPEYFDELKRISMHQIIWGGNYFSQYLESNNNWIVWYKNNAGTHMSMAELAWCSIRKNIQLFELRPMGLVESWHPTSKPVKLYKWLLQNYAKEGNKILDTHVGSGSSIIACIDMGFEYMGFEIDKDYYRDMKKRIFHFTRQTKLEFGE